MMTGYRTITVNGAEYKFKIGRTAAVIRDPSGHGHVVDLPALTGRAAEALEVGKREGSEDGMVGPRHIRRWIETEIAPLAHKP
jgi:hypothetical protein